MLNMEWEFKFEIKIAVQQNSIPALAIDMG